MSESDDEPGSPYENIKRVVADLDALLDEAGPVVDAVRDALTAAEPAEPAAPPHGPAAEPALR